MKIAIVVQGRFHAFDLAKALLERKHSVTVFTNYPIWAVERFGLLGTNVRSFWIHGILERLLSKIPWWVILPYRDAWLNPMFGEWVCKQLSSDSWDVVHLWSGVAEEFLDKRVLPTPKTLLMRGSAHISVQAQLLEQERQRTGCVLDHPGSWTIARERREYLLADKISVLSTFAYQSFVDMGVSPEQLEILPLGAQLQSFSLSPQEVNTRCQRIASGEPLHVLYVGALSLRKGLWDLAIIAQQLSGSKFEFCCVGSILPEAAQLVKSLKNRVVFVSQQAQSDLKVLYAWADIFIFPTIEDGYAIVLAQAAAAGLPILTTTNCAGPDLIVEGETGWVLPIRSPEAFIERLLWCNEHRVELAAMARRIPDEFQPRDWAAVAADFESICSRMLTLG